MAFKTKSALSHIPEFYLEEKVQEDIIVNNDGIYENAELLNPNSVNLTANLIDMINSKRVTYNNWDTMDDYIQEFKLDTLFTDNKFYSVKQPELLKGFFKFKGTDTDIKYIMKVAGYDLVIHQHNSIIAYGLNGAKDEASGAIYEEEMDHSFDCELTSELYIDLDRPDFDGFQSRDVVKKIRGLLDARIALCVYLSAIELNLVTRTFFHIREKLDDAQLIDLEIESSSDFKQLAISSDPTSRVANNVNPYKADGTPIIGSRVYIPAYDFTELDLDKIVCDKESFVNDKIYSRKVNNTNPQSVQSGTVDNCSYQTLQGQAINNPFERGYDYRVDNETPLVIDNIDKAVVEGRLYQLGDTFIKEEDTPIAVAIGGNRHYRVNNTNPIKIRNSKPERQIIEDNTFDVQSSKTTVDTHFRYKQMSDNTLVSLDRDVNDFLDNTKMSVSNGSPFRVGNLPHKIKGNSEITIYKDSNLVDLDKELFETYYMAEQDFGYIVDNQSGVKVVNIHWKKQIIVQGGKPKFYYPADEIQLTNDIGWELTNEGFYLSGNSLEELQELYPSSSYTIEYTPKTIIISVLNNELSYNVDNKGKLKVRGKALTQIDDYSIDLSFDLGLTKDEIDIHLINTVERADGSRKVVNHYPFAVSGTYMSKIYTVSDNLITSFSEDFIGGDLHLLNNVGGLLVTNNQPLSVKGQANKMEYLSDELELYTDNEVKDILPLTFKDYRIDVDGRVIDNKDVEVVIGYEPTVYPLSKVYRVGEETIIVDNINPIEIKGRLVQEGEVFEYEDNTIVPTALDNMVALKVDNRYPMKTAGVILGHRNYEEMLLIQVEIEFSPYRLKIGGYDVLDTKRGYVGNTKVNNDSEAILLEAVV